MGRLCAGIFEYDHALSAIMWPKYGLNLRYLPTKSHERELPEPQERCQQRYQSKKRQRGTLRNAVKCSRILRNALKRLYRHLYTPLAGLSTGLSPKNAPKNAPERCQKRSGQPRMLRKTLSPAAHAPEMLSRQKRARSNAPKRSERARCDQKCGKTEMPKPPKKDKTPQTNKETRTDTLK